MLANLHVLEDMRTTTMYTVNADGHLRDTVDANAKASTPRKDADEQQLRRWTESQAHS